MHSWWKTQDFRKIESGPDYTTAANVFVKATSRLGLQAPFVARNKNLPCAGQRPYDLFCNLVPRAHVPFGQHLDTELWNNQFPETKILGLPAPQRMRGLI